MPMTVPRAFAFTGLSIQVTTAAASSSVYVSIFNEPTLSGSNLVFAAPINTVGPFTTTTTGTKSITGLSISLPIGVYWVGVQAAGANPSLACPTQHSIGTTPYAYPTSGRPDIQHPIISGATAYSAGGNYSVEAGKFPSMAFTGVTYP